ncbi:MAG: sensor histidine kinase [Anaerolineae bacterium]
MNRLWVRLSVAMTVVVLLAAIAPLLTIFLIVVVRAFVVAPIGSASGLIDYFDSYWAVAFDDGLNLAVAFLFDETGNAIMTAVALALGMGISAGIWVSRQFARPISELAAGANRLRHGELGYQIRLSDKSDEVQGLATDFNGMSAELAQAEQLRRNLIADVSHELRTPLTVLEGRLRGALDHFKELDEKSVANLYGQTTHLIKLVEDLHLLSRAEADQLSLELAETDLSMLLREVVWNFELVAAENEVSLECNVPGLLMSVVDAARIRQVCSNLVSNAIRHTPAGGSILVEAAATDGHVLITFHDTGEGIETDQLAHLFDRFYRTDSSRTRDSGGSGLGLAIVKSLVEAHGGAISVESAGLGHGASFRIQLPQLLPQI